MNSTVNLSVVAAGGGNFVSACYIIVNADVAHCFVFTNKAVLLLSTILPAAFVDSDQDKRIKKESRDKINQAMEVLLEEGR